MSALTRSELERRHLADLHELASANRVARFRSLPRPELIEAILEASPEEAGDAGAEPSDPALDERESWLDFEGEEGLEDESPEDESPEDEKQERAAGVLDLVPDGYGFLRVGGLKRSEDDLYVSRALVRRLGLRTGDELSGPKRPARRSDRYASLVDVETVNGAPAQEVSDGGRLAFDELTPVSPRKHLELDTESLPVRMIDAVAPFGKGQRCLILSPPGAGGTTLLRDIARGVVGHRSVMPTIVLVDARPEEVTEWRRALDGGIYGASSDQSPEAQVRIAELALEHAKRQAEQGNDAIVLLDSITRLARARSLTQGRPRRSGRHDGEDAASEIAAIRMARHWFSAARNTEEQGSLTIATTVRVQSDSRFEQLLYEAVAEIANMELRLDRSLSQAGLFPAIDVNRSWSRHDPDTDASGATSVTSLRTSLGSLAPQDAWQAVAERIRA